jgi:hypothetical protein
MRTIVRSVMTDASADGTPRRRIQRIAGANADAKMRARSTGMVTTVTDLSPMNKSVAMPSTMSACSERVARRPKPSAHIPSGGFSTISSATAPAGERGGVRRNRPMRRP